LAACKRHWPEATIVTKEEGMKSKFVNKDGFGNLFKFKNKDNPNSPDYYGSVRLTGINYKIGAWKKQSSKTGETFLSLSVQPESEETQKPGLNDSWDF
jgi:uncharacterized protein (DUF736 family)